MTNAFAKDLDAGENGTVTLSLLTGKSFLSNLSESLKKKTDPISLTPRPSACVLSVGAEGQRLRHFEIDGKSGDIRTTSLFKQSAEAAYSLQVTARDGGSPPLEDTALIHVQVHLWLDETLTLNFPNARVNAVHKFATRGQQLTHLLAGDQSRV